MKNNFGGKEVTAVETRAFAREGTGRTFQAFTRNSAGYLEVVPHSPGPAFSLHKPILKLACETKREREASGVLGFPLCALLSKELFYSAKNPRKQTSFP